MLNARDTVALSRTLFATALFFALFFASAVPGGAADPAALAITSFSLETKQDAVLIQSNISLHNAADVRALLRGGAKMLLRCSASLEKTSTLFFDDHLSDCARTFLVRQDSLTREFIVSDGKLTFRLKKLIPLLQLAWKESPLLLPLKEPLEPGETYQLTLTLNLEYADVPTWMEKNLLFWSREVTPPLVFSQSFRF